MPAPTEITVSQLSRLIGTPQAPLIIDVRIDEDFALDPNFIPGAKRHAHTAIPSLLPSLPASAQQQGVVVYCQKGKKISQGAMALLRLLFKTKSSEISRWLPTQE